MLKNVDFGEIFEVEEGICDDFWWFGDEKNIV